MFFFLYQEMTNFIRNCLLFSSYFFPEFEFLHLSCAFFDYVLLNIEVVGGNEDLISLYKDHLFS